jgi:energy-coupling factor transporter transmembrane protein EcfT
MANLKLTGKSSLSKVTPGWAQVLAVIFIISIWLIVELISAKGTGTWLMPFTYGLTDNPVLTIILTVLLTFVVHGGRIACGFIMTWKDIIGIRILMVIFISIFTIISMFGSYSTNNRSVELAKLESFDLTSLQEAKTDARNNIDRLQKQLNDIPPTWKKWTTVNNQLLAEQGRLEQLNSQISEAQTSVGVDKIQLSQGQNVQSRLWFWILIEFICITFSFLGFSLIDWADGEANLAGNVLVSSSASQNKVNQYELTEEDDFPAPQIQAIPTTASAKMGFQSNDVEIDTEPELQKYQSVFLERNNKQPTVLQLKILRKYLNRKARQKSITLRAISEALNFEGSPVYVKDTLNAFGINTNRR